MGAPSFVAEGRQLVEELRRELRAAAGAAAAASVPRTKDLDAKLASLEGSVLSAGRAAREAAAAAGVKLPEALARESRGQFEAIVMALRQELARAMEVRAAYLPTTHTPLPLSRCFQLGSSSQLTTCSPRAAVAL